jgi:hypothetical protein
MSEALKLVPQANITDQDLGEQKPIAVTLNAQDIGRLHVLNGGPRAFIQFLLERFKAAGAPVTGVLELKLEHGRICKTKDSIQGKGFFNYVWLPDTYIAAIEQMGGFNPPWLQ